MPLFVDFHNDMQGITRDVACEAHYADVDIQDSLGVKIHKFWMNEEKGFVFCLMEAPNKEACEKVHRMSHGHMACEIIEVTPADIITFMGPGQIDSIGQAVHPDGKYDSAVRTFLFTDIVGSTSLTQKYGDSVSFKILRKHNQIVRNAIGKYAGKEIKHTGDGIMACFSSTSKSVSCAIEIQKELHKHRVANPDIPLEVKIGLNAGEPVTEGDDFFGAAVQLCARLCDLGEANQILVSSVVKNLCLGKNVPFEDIGKIQLKGFEHPVEVAEVLWNQ